MHVIFCSHVNFFSKYKTFLRAQNSKQNNRKDFFNKYSITITPPYVLNYTVKPAFKTTWYMGTTWELRTPTSVPRPVQYIEMDLWNRTPAEFSTVFHSALDVPNFLVSLFLTFKQLYFIVWTYVLPIVCLAVIWFVVTLISFNEGQWCIWYFASLLLRKLRLIMYKHSLYFRHTINVLYSCYAS